MREPTLTEDVGVAQHRPIEDVPHPLKLARGQPAGERDRIGSAAPAGLQMEFQPVGHLAHQPVGVVDALQRLFERHERVLG